MRYSYQILINLEFSRQIFKNKFQIPSFIKMRLVGAEFYPTDGRTDIRKLRLFSFSALRMRLKRVVPD